MSHDPFMRETDELLARILDKLCEIERRLEPRFTLIIWQVDHQKHFDPFGNWRTQFMASITAGLDATFFLTATASDDSTPVLADAVLTADDSNVIISPGSDANTFVVKVPESDTATTFNLSASASVTSNTSPNAQTITATLPVTISPAAVPVTFTLSINEK